MFTDIEGSTRLWEREPSRMHDALARHDALAAETVAANHGRIVKSTGDGIHAAFGDPLDAVRAAIALQIALVDPAATAGVGLSVRCGLHAGVDVRRANDFYGNAVNRAARVMSAAHGGQVLLSEAVATLVRSRLPESIELVELGAVRLRDLSEPENLFQAVHAGLRRDFPALRSLESTPNNLPQQLTSFIGREHELAEVRRMLKDARLLTIFGIGGLGKSRLSLHVATDALKDYPDGVWFVELAPIADARLVPQAVASVLGVKDESGEAMTDTIAKFARDRHLLLVLDNCEHLTQACAELARKILESARNVAILATSRERLGIAGEKTYPLAPFAVPLPRQRLAPDAILSFASVRLFAERAAAARPDFAITRENAVAVAEICHRLDGIPLALELAAARVRGMPVQKIAERLIDRFKLLSGGDRTALPRQQTLRALIDWSYDLLTEKERTLFRRLAVFVGGFTLEAAESVGAGEPIAEPEVMDIIAGLVEKSLVTLDTEWQRYRMLETVQQYADQHLRAVGEERAVRERHLDFYLALAESARPKLFGPEQVAWLARLDQERENLMSAHLWCDHADRGAERGLRLLFVTKAYWINRGLVRLGHQLTAEALGRTGASERNIARSRGLFDLGQLDYVMGRHADAQTHLEESLAIAREIDDAGRIAATLQPLGLAYLCQDKLAQAKACLEEALALARPRGDRREIAAAATALAMLHRTQASFDSAEALYREGLCLSRELGDRVSIGISATNLAIVAVSRGHGDEANGMLREALSIAQETGSTPLAQSVLEVTAAWAAFEQRWEQAACLFGASEALGRQTGLQRDAVDAAFLLPWIDAARRALGATEFAVGEATGYALAQEAALSQARTWLGDSA